jgi:hypothetical protein
LTKEHLTMPSLKYIDDRYISNAATVPRAWLEWDGPEASEAWLKGWTTGNFAHAFAGIPAAFLS